MKTQFKYFIPGVVLFFFILNACHHKAKMDKNRENYIITQLKSLVDSSTADSVFPNLDWDYMFCMEPYTNPERLTFLNTQDQQLLLSTSIQSLDDREVVVFIKSDTIAFYGVIMHEAKIAIIGQYWPKVIQKQDFIANRGKSSISSSIIMYFNSGE